MEDLLMKSVNKHYFPEKERKELAKEGEAMPDGSFPIRNHKTGRTPYVVSVELKPPQPLNGG